MAGGEARRGSDQHVLDLGRFLLGAEVSAWHLSWPEGMRVRSCQMLCAVTGFEGKTSVHRYEIVLRYRRALVQRYLDGSPLHPELELQGEEMEPQLEELEDKEESETELWLNADGTVTLGRTNGPPVKDFKGDWHVLETAGEGDKPFRMRLTRSYESPR